MFLRLNFKMVNDDERTHKVPARAVPDYKALTSYVLKYLDKEPHMAKIHIHTKSGPCVESTLVYEDNYNTGCFSCEDAAEAPPLHVHLVPKEYVPISMVPSASASAIRYDSADDLNIQAIKRITNGKDERLVVGRTKRCGAAVYAVLCRNHVIRYLQTDLDLDGKAIPGKATQVKKEKIKFFRGMNNNTIREQLEFRRKAMVEKRREHQELPILRDLCKVATATASTTR
ncbi:uncharacterized protein BKCO1_1700039 [Diplodia corticola]|uniref:Uncharacterized protein n=1 Tax=Diplodia corticola TaxID=236234 RepID=A0A1J9R4A9_9PEZI|nr:uncharacterized protein BKCO1_1700039 [Diplodia corticola]OJD35440.1 hypothetical protein BKCO1_1700039 [Diplodia corticola]